MSSPSTTAHDGSPLERRGGVGTILRPVETLGFWAAVGLPFVYMPMLLTGVETSAEQLAVAVLLSAHVLALYLGRRHNAE
jgi:hypothetical protein